jgi:HK97 family phage portal protein
MDRRGFLSTLAAVFSAPLRYFAKAIPQRPLRDVSALSSPLGSGGWTPLVRESYPGAWQQNVELRAESLLAYFAVYACQTLIANDIAKMRLKLVQQDDDDIWIETESASFSPVLRKPNHFQTRVQFYQWWITSKLAHGNTYVLKERDNRGVVIALYVLDPARTRVLVAPDGSVFYELQADPLASVLPSEMGDRIAVPAREIIHDLCCPLFHPLVGVSPIFACGMSALQGLQIQTSSSSFFGKGAKPSGVVSAPGQISQATADRLKAYWETAFAADNAGRVAILGDGLKYEPITMTAVDAQLIEQLKFTAETVCACYHVPPYMIGIAPPPNYNNIEALSQQYYAQALQIHIESLEVLMDEGLALPDPYGTEFELDDLLRMDTATLIDAEKNAVGAGIKSPNESRARLNLKPVQGGETPYLQQQNYSLAALDRRDAEVTEPTVPPEMPAPTPTIDEQAAKILQFRMKAAALNLLPAA